MNVTSRTGIKVLVVVAVVGLGYVGLPVAVAFGKERRTIGYDLSRKRIESLRRQVDATGEVSTTELMAANQLRASADPASPTCGRSSWRAKRSAAT